MNSIKARSVGIILLVVFLTHFANVFNDGVYSDGWMIYHFIQDADFNKLRLLYADAGISSFPPHYFWILGSLGDFILTTRISTFCIIVLTNIAIYYHLQKL